MAIQLSPLAVIFTRASPFVPVYTGSHHRAPCVRELASFWDPMGAISVTSLFYLACSLWGPAVL